MTDEAVHRHSPPEAKISLFRSLFRGRDDVYARRFESSKTGISGYQPACGNEWDRVLCDKRRVKCHLCPNRRFLPLTDDVIRRHLSGRGESGKDFVVGIYPMLQDETCLFLAVDFDKKSWTEDAGGISGYMSPAGPYRLYRAIALRPRRSHLAIFPGANICRIGTAACFPYLD